MPAKTVSILKTIIPLFIGIFLVWYSFHGLTGAQIQTTWNYMKQASPVLIALSVFMGLMSHFSRAWRWKFLLEPMGYKPKFINSLLTVLMAYLINLGIPRAGEVSRAASLASYENIPFNKVFGTIIAERIIDLIILFGLIAVVILFQTDDFMSYLIKEDFSVLNIILLLIVLAGMGFACLRFLRVSKIPFIIKIRHFMEGIWEGFRSLKDMPNKGYFWMHSLLIWLLYILMFYVVMLSIPETADLPLIAMLTAFVIGGLSMSTTNGGIGVYPIAIQQILLTYGVSPESGLAFGWIIWIAQTLLVLTFGLLSFVLLPIVNKKSLSSGKN
ncbi:MAG: flippase-like domain-containing protein [Bacteroidetes bacterium]|nr:flippase-like domain-containing protein [Bacteroidota bacterium]